MLAAPNLLALYQQVAPEALLGGTTLAEVASAKHAHPKYCLKMATGTGKTWVLQALLVWQLLNANAARANAAVDPRFTRNFLLVAPGLIVYDHLLDAFCGKLHDGVRDFATSDVACYAELFLPEGQRETVFGFVRGNVCAKEDTLFGDYRVDGVVMNVTGYNDFLTRLTRRIGQALSQPLPRGNRIASHLANPYLQVNSAELAAWLDEYIRERLFGAGFEPLADESWRLLLLQPVLDHVTKVFAVALIDSEARPTVGQTEVLYRHLSEVGTLPMRESSSLAVAKCIYERLPYPARNGGLEKAFIEWAQADSGVAAFCKISETRHDFVRLRYVKEDGLPAFCSPDFLVGTQHTVYLVETKAEGQLTTPNVQRKLKAAAAWCERINGLAGDVESAKRNWHYVLLGERLFDEWRSKGARLPDLLDFARIRPVAGILAQGRLNFNGA
ncbi:MAG: DEAD/DEAH box helicase family protein [Candidatus Dechloromonas phosphoritropha]